MCCLSEEIGPQLMARYRASGRRFDQQDHLGRRDLLVIYGFMKPVPHVALLAVNAPRQLGLASANGDGAL